MPEDNSLADIAQDVTPVVPTPEPTPVAPVVEPTPEPVVPEPTPVVVPEPTPAPAPEPVVVPEPAPAPAPEPVVVPAPVPEPVVAPAPVVVPDKVPSIVADTVPFVVMVPVAPKEDFVVIPTESVENYNKHGEVTENPNDAVVAKKVTSGGSTVFKLAFFGSSLYNPVGPFSTREKAIKNSFKYLVVNEEDFKTFLLFLETRNLNTYHSINRKVLNNV